MSEPETDDERARLDDLSSELGEVLPDDLDAAGAEKLIAELQDREDHGESTYTSE
ncbi:hypothetical protein [Cryptosporangium phraense]|uniref:hypothetical protein n=1 Tax=Cryptosporangium phraense TaxID=2593070 RepID=UPI0014780A53|nr:hypothetical protein [Cryptosporangium phraense]